MARDYGYEAQRAAEAHLGKCMEAEYAAEEGGELADSPAVAPFDGCDTCQVREVLHAGWPFAVASVIERVAVDYPAFAVELAAELGVSEVLDGA